MKIQQLYATFVFRYTIAFMVFSMTTKRPRAVNKIVPERRILTLVTCLRPTVQGVSNHLPGR